MSEWPESALGDVVDLDPHVVPVAADATYEIVGVLNRGRGLLHRGAISGSDTSYKTLNRIGPNQIVYSRLKAFEGAITVTPPGLAESYASPEFPTFTCRPGLMPEYFALLTTTPRLWEELQRVSIGMGGRRERVKPRDFLTIQIQVPSLAEQRRIVHVVSAVDALFGAAQDEADRLDGVWWSIATDMVEALAPMPHVRLDSIADISGGLTKNKTDLERPNLVDVPYLRVANVHRRYLDLSEVATIRTTQAKVDALRLLPGDVLFNEGGDRDKLGRGAVWQGEIDDCIHQNHVFRARVTDDAFDPRFVSAWGNTFGKKWFEKFGTQTTGIASINKATLSRFPIPNVDLTAQRTWVAGLEDVLAAYDALKDELTQLKAFRATLLTALLDREVEIPESYDSLLEGAC